MHRRTLSLVSLLLSFLLFFLLIISVQSGNARDNANDPTPLPPMPESLNSSRQPSPRIPQTELVKIHPLLLRQILDGSIEDSPRIIIEWQRDPQIYQKSISLLEQSGGREKAQIRTALVSELMTDMETNTAGIMKVLTRARDRAKASDIRRYWISPVISLRASPETILELAGRDDVRFIRPDEQIQIEPITFSEEKQQIEANGETSQTGDYIFNLDMLDVDRAEQLFGLNGNGAVVAIIDTGVDFTHPALMKKYRGYNPNGAHIHAGNWFVATSEPYLVPGDGYGHGTHVMGTILGDDELGHRIGVAPQAKWIAVKAFTNQGYTYESWLHAALEWVMAPNGDPALAPDVVNNSWGSVNGYDTRFQQDVAALLSAGIFPVFSAGNNGPSVGTIGSPASYPESFAVGAVDINKLPASFSSRGPSPWGEIKPQISAPGINIVSSFPGGGYTAMEGTSMAAPHVTGVIALLLQANPTLSPSQIKQVLLDSAEPLGTVIPNNTTGYGLVNALSAALQVTQYGLLSGAVYDSSTLTPIPSPTVTITSRDPVEPFQITIAGDASGRFQVPLPPDYYDITASGFGYNPQTTFSQYISQTKTNRLDFYLDPLPRGRLRGRVLEAQTQSPISATLTVENTPLSAQSDPSSGDYQLYLPDGTYTITIKADAYRVLHINQTVQASHTYDRDFLLENAPRILLVDSGVWYYRSQIEYYKSALDSLDYTYDNWAIRSPFGQNSLPDDRPTTSTLSAYDLVIWSSPLDSPGLLSLGSVISTYLSSGGNILLSGQDVAYLDGGGPNYYPQQPYFEDLFGIRYFDEGYLENLFGAENSPFAGLEIAINTPDSANQQVNPDAVTINNDKLTQPALEWQIPRIGGTLAENCAPYKALWLGFGFEGSGPHENRLELLRRAMDWFSAPKSSYSMIIHSRQNETITDPGGVLTATLEIINNGTQADSYQIQLNQGIWQSTISLPNGQTVNDSAVLTIPSCQSTILTATLPVPSSALRNEVSNLSIHINSQNAPGLSSNVTFTAKSPASLLIVDDQLFYNNLDQFTSSLNSAAFPYDVLKTNGFGSPLTDTLKRYPLVFWLTGYDWYFTLSAEDEKRLSQFLDQGGGLMLTSQDVLDIRGADGFFRDKMGVIGTMLSITPTQAIATLGNPLSLPPKSASLSFPFTNWGDAMIPSSQSIPLFHEENLRTIGLLHPLNQARSAFFSFPLETMPQSHLEPLLSRLHFWLSPAGNTLLELPDAVTPGGEVPITIHLRSTGNSFSSFPTGSKPITEMRIPLPQYTSLIPDSLSPGWVYLPAENQLLWQGSLDGTQEYELNATLQVSEFAPTDSNLQLVVNFSDEKGFVTKYSKQIPFNRSHILITKDWNPRQAQPGETVTFTITMTNSGVLADTARLTETLTTNLSLLSDSIVVSQGDVQPTEGGLIWQTSLDPRQSASLTYRAVITDPTPPRLFFARSLWSSSYDNWLAYSKINVPYIYFFPFIGN